MLAVWELVPRLLSVFYLSSRCLVSLPSLASPISGLIPLHFACSNQADLGVIQPLVRVSKDQLYQKGEVGKTAVYMVCSNRVSQLEVVKYLVDLDPARLQMQNKQGCLPLHAASQFNNDLAVLEYLIETNPDTIYSRDTVGDHAMRYACHNKESLEFSKLLVEKDPFSVKEQNNTNDLPLHTACGHALPSEAIVFLTKSYPESVKSINSDGWTPLHVAVTGTSTRHARSTEE